MRGSSICPFLLVLCLGCDYAASRRQEQQDQRDATVNELKQLGQTMHADQTSESASSSDTPDAQENAAGSTDRSSSKPATVEQGDAAKDD